MKIARVEVNGVMTYGIVEPDGNLYDLVRMLRTVSEMRGQPADPPRSMLETAMGGARLHERFLDARRELMGHGLLSRFALPEGSKLHAPLTRPNRILAIGRNYAEHAKEQGVQVAGWLRRYEPGLVGALHLAEALVRNPAALARLLQATGGGAIEQIGGILARDGM